MIRDRPLVVWLTGFFRRAGANYGAGGAVTLTDILLFAIVGLVLIGFASMVPWYYVGFRLLNHLEAHHPKVRQELEPISWHGLKGPPAINRLAGYALSRKWMDSNDPELVKLASAFRSINIFQYACIAILFVCALLMGVFGSR